MTGLSVNVVCRNNADDRVIPRFSRYLRDCLGWTLTDSPQAGHALYYLSGYFEYSPSRTALNGQKFAAYFTHRETEPPGNAKAALFDSVASIANLRIATAAMYADQLSAHGTTIQAPPPVERGLFTIAGSRNTRFCAGFSGYTYANKRKGEDMARLIVKQHPKIEWRASGRGWPISTAMYKWSEMPSFYRSLDCLIVTSRVEGVPMPPLECLSCGVSVVIPHHVGLLDELPDIPGIHRYQVGSAPDAARALGEAIAMRSSVDRDALREATAPYTITAWCDAHRAAFEELMQ